MFNSYAMTGDRLSADMTSGATRAMVEGPFTDTNFTAAVTAQVSGSMPGAVVGRSLGKRVGDCAN